MPRFPALAVESGSYASEWKVGTAWLPGEVELRAHGTANLAVFGDVLDIEWADGEAHDLMQTTDFDTLQGRTRSGYDLFAIGARLLTWFPGRVVGSARIMLAGLGIDELTHERINKIRFQVTGLDALIRHSPIKEVTWPTPGAEEKERRFSAVLNPVSDFEWEHEGLTYQCSYDVQWEPGPYRFGIQFAPVIAISSEVPRSVEDWLVSWVTPCVNLVSIACRSPQELSWLTVHYDDGDRERSAVVFGRGIAQEPYAAGATSEQWRDPRRQPLFSFRDLPQGLPFTLLQWHALNLEHPSFMQLCAAASGQPDLPARAAFLYRIQALEALHGSEHASEDRARQEEFAKARRQALDAIRSTANEDVYRFVAGHWSKRASDSLERRLRDLLGVLPEGAHDVFTRPSMEPLKSLLVARGDLSLEGLLQRLRNDLSHGNEHYDDSLLRPWADTADMICQGHIMRLLGFSSAAIVAGLHAAAVER